MKVSEHGSLTYINNNLYVVFDVNVLKHQDLWRQPVGLVDAIVALKVCFKCVDEMGGHGILIPTKIKTFYRSTVIANVSLV